MKNKIFKKVNGSLYFAINTAYSRLTCFLLASRNVFFLLLLILLLLTLLAKYCCIPYLVLSDSMLPNINKNSLVIVRKSKIKVGDIVALRQGNKILVKRIIAMPNEEVVSDGKNFYTRNCIFKLIKQKIGFLETVYCPKLHIQKEYKIIPYKLDKFTAKYNGYFVLGDNRKSSIDSRYFGAIRPKDIIGKVIYVWR